MPTPLAQASSGSDEERATSLTLIERIRGYDQDAWTLLVRLYTPFVRYWCRRWGIRGAETEDILQEVFQAVSLGLKNFRRDREGDSFRGWLRGITRNKVLDVIRRGGTPGQGGTDFYERSLLIPERESYPFDEDQEGEEAVVGALYEEAVRLVRGEFEDRTWMAFWRTVVEGQSPALVAEEIGVTPATIRQYKSRVLRRLKQVLGEPPDPISPQPDSQSG